MFKSSFGQQGAQGTQSPFGFGQQPAQSSPFGAPAQSSPFGATNNTLGSANPLGGGQPATASPFGAPAASPFGAPASNTFGSGTTTASSPFGNTAGGAFGNAGGSGSSTFGGSTFGSSNPLGGSALGSGSTAGSGTGFGASSGLGGGNALGSGSANNSFGGSSFGGSTFGGGAAAGGGAFGSTPSTSQSGGTSQIPFSVHEEKEKDARTSQFKTERFQAITMMPQYRNNSFQELRWQDYQNNVKGPSVAPVSTGFGFGAQSAAPATGMQAGQSGGLFGGNSPSPFGSSTGNNAFGASAFGQNNSTGTGAFGSTNNNTGGGLFGQNNNTGSASTPFGTSNNTFGAAPSTTSTGFGFGSNTNTSSTGGGGLFGQNNSAASPFGKPASTPFGQPASTTGTSSFGFGNTQNNNTTSSPFGAANSGGSSLFGQNNNNASGGAFGQKQSLFGSNTTSNPPVSTGTGLFGQSSQPSSGFGFGQTNNTSGTSGAFGQNSNSTFGQNNTSTFGQSNTGGNAFGFGGAQNKPATGGLFGQSQPSQPSGGGLFGSKPATGGGLFGQPAAPAAPAAPGAPGAPQSTGFGSQGGGGLFGQSKPAFGQSSGGLFGQNNQSAPTGGGLFGNNNTTAQPNAQPNTAAGGGLFGNTQPSGSTGGGLFGNNTANAAPNPSTGVNTGAGLGSGGLFGNNNQASNSGNTSGGLFGSKPATTGGGLFGNANTASNTGTGTGGGGLFGNAANAAPAPAIGANNAQSGLFGKPAAVGATTAPQSSLFGNTAPAPAGPVASIDSNAYLSNPLFANIRENNDVVENRPTAKSKRESPNFKPPSGVLLAQITQPRSLPKGRRLTDTKAIEAPEPSDNAIIASKPSTPESSKLVKFKNAIYSNNTDDLILNSDAFDFAGRRKQITMPGSSTPKKVDEEEFEILSPSVTNIGDEDAEEEGEYAAAREAESSKRSEASEVENMSAEDSPDNEMVDGNGYWISPSKRKILSMTVRETRSVKNFRVGQRTMGFVEFLEPVDLSRFSDVQAQVCGHLVVFSNRAFCLYPDDSKRPPVGQGFNVKHRVTLYNIFAHNRETHEPVKDPEHPVARKYLKKLTAQSGFVSWSAQTGTWTFEVDPALSE